MKLNYRDKVILGAVLALALLIAGFFLLIKPEIDDIGTNKDQLAELQAKEAQVADQIAEIPELKDDIMDIYADSKTMSEPFLEYNSIYDSRKVDQYMQSFATESKVKILSLTPGDLSAGTLGYYYFEPVIVGEDMRTSVDINGSDAKYIAEQKAESESLSDRTEEQVLSATYTVTLEGSKEDLWKYMETIENQPETIIINSIGFTNLQIKEIEDDDDDEDEEILPTAQMTLTLYSVYEMNEPNVEAE
ncbi:MAG: hypothetical protein NC093_04900 [Alistipes sp.]|nr:hypothetical protein [Alistipes sp.]